MSDPSTLADVQISVEGHSQSIAFSNLVIIQKLADVNDFSFNWRQEEGAGSLSAYVNFNRNNLAKEVTIDISNNFTFKGIICSINCVEQDFNGITYEIAGKGLFVKLLELPSCNSFYQKDLQHIFNTLNVTQGTTLQLNPGNTDTLYYTVQYNQSAFEFYKMLATRYGEWLYYNGRALVLGPPQGDAVPISDTEIDHLTFRSKLEQPPMNTVSYDSYLGQAIHSTEQAPQPAGTGFIAANMQAGASLISASDFSTYSISGAATEGLLTSQSLLLQNAAAAASTVITGNTYNSNLKLAGKINLTDNDGNSFGEYIITELRHSCAGATNYQNYFSAIPSEVPVPPYTNPLIHAWCPAQLGVVVDNEDADGHDRVKVRFPWQLSTENSPWIRVVTPLAGDGYGFRFLPEIDDLVYIDFTDNDPERPFLLGSIYTGNRRSGTQHEGNNLKIFGTRTGRRLEINDDTGELRISDNVSGRQPVNTIALIRDDNNSYATIQSQKSDSETSLVFIDGARGASLTVMDGDTSILSVELVRDDNKIRIYSKGNIDINADGNINMSAGNININASQELKLNGTAKGVKMDGQKITQKATTNIEIEATANMKVSGLNTTVQGNVQAEIKGGAMVNLTAAIVKIN